MLIWMREGAGGKAMKVLLLSLMTMAVVGLVLMDVGGFFRGDVGAGTIAKGEGVNVSAVEFDNTVRRVLSAQGIGAAEAYQLGLIDQIAQGEIRATLFAQKAHDLGLMVGDDDVRAQIVKLAEPLAANGQDRKSALQQLLRQQGYTEAGFVAMLREEMASTILRGAITPPASLTSPLIANALYRYDGEKRSVSAIVLKNNAVRDVTPPSEESLQKYYETNKRESLIPETRTITMATLKPQMLAGKTDLSDEDLRAEYEKRSATYKKSGARTVEQALFEKETDAKKAADAVKGGKSLKDSVPADAYIAPKAYEPEGMLAELRDGVFAAKTGDVIGPVQTSIGWQVAVVGDIRPDTVTSFEDAKAALKAELESAAATDAMVEAGNAIEDRSASGEPLENLVKEYGMTTEIIGPFRVTGANKDGKDLFVSYAADRAPLIEAAFDTDEGETAPLVETDDGQFRLVRVDQVLPDSYRTYDSVKAELSTRWMEEQRRAANKARAEKALADLNDGKTLGDVARELGASTQNLRNIGRRETPPAPLTAMVAGQIFAAEKDAGFSGELEDGFIVGTVTDITMPASVPAKSEDMDALVDLTGRTLAQDIQGQYVMHLTDGKDIRINQRQIDAMYGPKPDEAQ